MGVCPYQRYREAGIPYKTYFVLRTTKYEIRSTEYSVVAFPTVSRSTRYFAYGSNMASTVMLERCPGAVPLGAARLDDHRLVFRLPSRRWGGHAADITPEEGLSVWGVLWEVTPDHLEILDGFEARYDRYRISATNGVPVDALTYRVKPEHVSADGAPDPRYLDHLTKGATEHALPAEYISSVLSKYGVRGT